MISSTAIVGSVGQPMHRARPPRRQADPPASLDLLDHLPNGRIAASLFAAGAASAGEAWNGRLEGMTIDEIIRFVDGLDGVLTLRPGPGDGSPEIAWGDTFFYYSPSGVVPERTQPFATIVTKDYPGDDTSELDRPEAFRVNIAAGKEAFVRWTGHSPRESAAITDDPSASDVLIAHPVYGSLGWLAVKNPGEQTDETLRELLHDAYQLARSRYKRRASSAQS
jgi:hypothetical protein